MSGPPTVRDRVTWSQGIFIHMTDPNQNPKILEEFSETCDPSTLEELRARMVRNPQLSLSLSPAEAIRAERDMV
jgi:hypothetical protein